MIFVTVGTHEQPFDRLVKYIDELKGSCVLDEDVIIQSGYSTYEPKYCEHSDFFPYKEMLKNVEDARIVITHGGPSSFIMPLQIGKIPIVVPRQKKFGEHVNDHQVDFCQQVAERKGNIIVALEIDDLGRMIENYDQLIAGMIANQLNNNVTFNRRFQKIVNSL